MAKFPVRPREYCFCTNLSPGGGGKKGDDVAVVKGGLKTPAEVDVPAVL